MDLNINSAWSATSAVLKGNFSFYDIKEIVGLAGFDSTQISHLVQCSGSSVSKGQLITEIEQRLSRYDDESKRHFLNIVIEEMVERNSKIDQQLEKYLSRLGWQVIDGAVIPIQFLDRNDLEELDKVSREDLVTPIPAGRDNEG